jgi:NADH-quinone oxidoreductase subunit A
LTIKHILDNFITQKFTKIEMIEQYIPVFLVIGIALIFALLVVVSSRLFGPQRPNSEKLSTYESGMKPVGTTHERISIKYYLVAMLFIIFDLEVIFIYPWAIQFKNLFGELGISVFISMFIFLVVLELGYLYVYKKGGFKWD